MVDQGDVLRGSATKKTTAAIFEARWKEFASGFKNYAPPDQAVLQDSVEGTAKCGKCKGGVRAVLVDAKPSNAFAFDLEILVSLNCRDAGCAWTANQWRTWVRTKPTEL
jgi:hypothetical protein